MILDIKTSAEQTIKDLEEVVKKLHSQPHLTIIMVGDNNASAVYVRNKIKTCESIGIKATLLHFAQSTTSELIREIHRLNADETVHGILVQSPLPSDIPAQEVFDVIHPKKDVDGFSSTNIARLYSGDETGLVPGTPKGIMKICFAYFQMKNAKSKEQNDNPQFWILNFPFSEVDDSHSALLRRTNEFWTDNKILEGKTAVVIGKSTIVGKPLSLMLMHAGATVTVCHSRTRDLSIHTKMADIIISAVGQKHLITTDMVGPGALVIDVGINVTEEDGRKLSGDCDTDNIATIADITPVPGGVGPMTIAMLLSNVLLAHELQWKN
jgi:methylenetetrahydrofolate dehydrogenase (NADP+)/methenyltetrahydrofolate cyclohydrolase